MRRSIILFLSLMFLFFPVVAQRKKVGLVLSGGGAKGAAHVGVLRVLEEAEIPIDYIAGTSIGAIVGGLYAVNHDVNTLDSLFRHQDWKLLFSNDVDKRYGIYSPTENKEKYLISLPLNRKQIQKDPAGLLDGHNLYNLFSDMTVGYHETASFNDLPIPFACVAVDLVSGKQVILNKGSLPQAIMASMALPGVFKPVVQDSMLLIDGGLLNNIPIDVVKSMGADVIIAIDLSTGWRTRDEVMQLSGMIDQILNIALENKTSKEDADLLLTPDLKGYNTSSFSSEKIDDMIQKGEEIAREHWDELMVLKAQIYDGIDTHELLPKNKQTSPSYWQLESILFDGISDHDEKWLKQQLPIKEGTLISMHDVTDAVAALYRTGLFSKVEYQLLQDDPCSIHFSLKSEPTDRINIGARIDTEDLASILLNRTVKNQFAPGTVFSLTARLNNNPYFLFSAQMGKAHNSKLGVSFRMRYNNIPLYNKRIKLDYPTFMSYSPEIVYRGSVRHVKYKMGMQFDYLDYKEEISYNKLKNITLKPEGFLNYFVTLAYDSRDQYYYPTKGFSMNLQGQMFTDNFIGYKKDAPLFSLQYNLSGVISLTERFYVLPSLRTRVLLGNDLPFIYQNFMGGELDERYLPQQISFPGIQRIQLFDNSLLVAKLTFRQRLWTKHYVSLSGAYANNSNKFRLRGSDNISGCSIQYAYDSIFGPAGLQLSYANHEQRLNISASIGYHF